MIERKWEEIDPAKAFFPVELRSVYMARSVQSEGQGEASNHNDLVTLNRHKAVVDIESNNVFSVVTDGYQLVINEEAYEQARAVMENVFNVTSLDDMACLNVTMPHTRSFCHIDLIRRDSEFSPWEEDKWTAFVRISNSYNRTKKLKFELGFCRWICLNGMIFGSKSVEVSFAHTKSAKEAVSGFSEHIGDIKKIEAELVESLHNFKRYHVPRDKMLPTVCRAFDIEVTKEVEKKEKRLKEMLAMRSHIDDLTTNYFNEMGENGYAALNVLTDFASYPVGGISPESRIDGLQKKANKWMHDFVENIEARDFNFDAFLGKYVNTAKLSAAL
jgi:hypothetical protein